MKPNRARLRSSRPPSLYAMSLRMVLQSFGSRPRSASRQGTFIMTKAARPQSSFVKCLANTNIVLATDEKIIAVDQKKLNCTDMVSTSSCTDGLPPATLWDSLTGDMQALVLSNIPFLILVAFRRVCKKWNQIILSPTFSNEMRENPYPKCVPLHFEEGLLVIFNSKRNAWEEQPLDFLGVPPESLSLDACCRGLLCFKDLMSGNFIICNPITKQWTRVQLPCGITLDKLTGVMARSQRPVPTKEGGKAAIDAFMRSFGTEVVAGMIIERHSRSYKLLVAGIRVGGHHRTTLVYDSLTNAWKKGGDVPRGVKFWESGKVVYSNGYFYSITYSMGLPRGHCDLDQPWSVVRYDIQNDLWSQVKIIRRGSVLSQLVEHNGRVLLVQRHCKRENEITFLEVEEESGTMSWLQAKTLPLQFFSAEKPRSSQIIEDWCVGQGNLLYIAGQEREGDYSSKKGRSLAMLAHDFTLDSWTPLPTLNLNGGYYHARSLHAFEPSLTAQA